MQKMIFLKKFVFAFSYDGFDIEYEKSYAFPIRVILKKGNTVARFMEKPQISTVIFSKQFAAEGLMNPPKIDIMKIGKSFFLKMILIYRCISGKDVSMKKFLSAFLAAVLTLGLVACKPNTTDQTTASTSSSSTSSTSDTQKPEQPSVNAVFDESKIVFSFAAISDIHIGRDTNNVEENKFKSALLQLKEQAAKHDADGIDAVLAVGDLFEGSGYGGSNTSGNLSSYKQIYQSVFNPTEVPMIHTEGNHDLKWDHTAKSVAAEHNAMFGQNYFLTDIDKNALAAEGNRHCVVNGYHILTLLPVTSTNVSYTQGTKNWLDQTLSEITAADPDAYVIVLTHPMIYDTVYGSTLGREPGTSLTDMWATSDLTDILSKYNQVITFGGHLHFPINDPRTIMQTSFTSLGCGSVNYMAIEDGKYENMASVTTMKDNTEYSQGLLCQIDENGNMRITRMDFYNETVIGTPWEIAHPSADGSHLAKFGKDRGNAENNQKPVLSGMEVIKGAPNASGKQSVSIEFGAATDDTFAHHYTLEFKMAGKTRRTFNILSDFYRVKSPDEMKKKFTHTIGLLSPNDYEVILTAYDSWGAASESLSVQFKVDGKTEDTAKKAEVYADFSFENGTVTDTRNNVTVKSNTATVKKTQVSFGGKTAEMDALVIGAAGQNAICSFTNLKTEADVTAFAEDGFCVEAFYVMGQKGPAVQGVICGTEAGGWGLAEDKTGKPYFITGMIGNAYNAGSYAKAASSETELVHVIGVYDFKNQKQLIYVNGVLQQEQAIKNGYCPGKGSAFNMFCLGADVKPDGSAGDFISPNMTMVDAKIYSGTLTEAEITAAYNTAAASVK